MKFPSHIVLIKYIWSLLNKLQLHFEGGSWKYINRQYLSTLADFLKQNSHTGTQLLALHFTNYLENFTNYLGEYSLFSMLFQHLKVLYQ